MEFPPLFFFGTNLASFCIVDSLNNLRFDRDPALDNTIRSMRIREICLLNESGLFLFVYINQALIQFIYFNSTVSKAFYYFHLMFIETFQFSFSSFSVVVKVGF